VIGDVSYALFHVLLFVVHRRLFSLWIRPVELSAVQSVLSLEMLFPIHLPLHGRAPCILLKLQMVVGENSWQLISGALHFEWIGRGSGREDGGFLGCSASILGNIIVVKGFLMHKLRVALEQQQTPFSLICISNTEKTAFGVR
jgi:hypothetical protein